MDPLFRAQVSFRRRDWDACISLCTDALSANPLDQVRIFAPTTRAALDRAVNSPPTHSHTQSAHHPRTQAFWLLKTRALTERAFVDELSWDDEGIAETLLDDHALASAPRVGTSISRTGALPRPGTSSSGSGALAAAIRPVTAAGRAATGFARPGTSAANGGRGGGIKNALRVGTSAGAAARAVTAAGRAVRLGTASMLSAPGGVFIDSARLDLSRYASSPALAKALAGYFLYVDGDAKRALELCALATVAAAYGDWYWKGLLGRAYAMLGLMRDAEQQLASALRLAPWNITLRLHAGRCALRADQPAAALRIYEGGMRTGRGAAAAASAGAEGDVTLLLAAARVQETMGNSTAAVALWRRALAADATSAEATACLAAQAFYSDQPEVALRHYRRLLLASGGGADAPVQLWVNIGLSTYYAGQFDLALPCLERALVSADGDAELADVWYNIGCVAVGTGDAALATQAWTIAIASDATHAEARTNLGVLEARKGNIAAARAHYAAAQRAADWLYEPFYNGALLAWRAGDVAAANVQILRALTIFPAHTESQELSTLISKSLK